MNLYRNFIILLIPLMLACNSGTETVAEKNTPVENTDQYTGARPNATDNRKILSTAEGGLITRVKKPSVLLFGQLLETDRNALFTSLQLITPGIIRQINNAGAVITGAVTFVYDGIPTDGETLRIFVGIPVKSRFRNEAETDFMTIPQGDYFEMTCRADVGQTAEFHKKMQQWIIRQGMKLRGPVFEIGSESRNNEMTVETRMNLFYKAP